MARSRLGLLAAQGSCNGPWILGNGASRVVARVHGLSLDARVMLIIQSDNIHESVALVEGDNLLEMKKHTQYRVKKIGDHGDTPTTVEFVYPEGGL
jgi:hypothetical protein